MGPGGKGPPPSASTEGGSAEGKDRILAVDDERDVVELLRSRLAAERRPCDATTSPAEALELLETRRYALLIAGLRMPGMSGVEVVRRAKRLDPHLAILATATATELSEAAQAMRNGADAYLLKPINMAELEVAVSSALDKRRLAIENSRLQHTNAELRRRKQYFEALLHSTVDAIITFDDEHRVSFANNGALQMLGYGGDEAVGLAAGDLFSGGADEVRYFQRLLDMGRPLRNYETELLDAHGERIPASMSVSRVASPDGAVPSTLVICKDITEQKRLEHELKELSAKDSLTGLYNQGAFYEKLGAEIERARRQGRQLSLVLLDVDRFKSYNDTHGHIEGDRVLRTVAEVIRESTRDHVDIGCRYGGDEFTVILPEADEERARAIAERIRRAFEAHQFDELTLSIGIMAYREGHSLRSFIQFTDAVMYDAKRAGGNKVFVFDPANPALRRSQDETKHEGTSAEQ